MKTLIILDIVAGIGLSIINSICQFSLNFLLHLISGLTLLLFPCLILANFIAIFVMWRKYKYFSFIPFIISLVFIPLLILSESISSNIQIRGTPQDPNSYFSKERKKELTVIAEELLQIKDNQRKPDIGKKLEKHHLMIRNIECNSNIVQFHGFNSQSSVAYAYIYAKNGLPEAYSIKPVITEEDIMSWTTLIDMVKAGNDDFKYRRGEVTFVPGIVYPFLIEKLDKAFVDKLSSLESYDVYAKKYETDPVLDGRGIKAGRYSNFIAGKISDIEKTKIIELLNQQCRMTSRLIEDSNITWRSTDSTLWLCNRLLESSVVKHLRRLISEGSIRIKDKEGHLEIKPDPNEKEILEIEWLNVELMRHVYSNLFRKEEYWSNNKIKLADNWYFYKWHIYRD